MGFQVYVIFKKAFISNQKKKKKKEEKLFHLIQVLASHINL